MMIVEDCISVSTKIISEGKISYLPRRIIGERYLAYLANCQVSGKFNGQVFQITRTKHIFLERV